MYFRLAALGDLPFLAQANWAWLQEQAASGGPLVPSVRSQRVHMDLVESYLRGEREGIAILAEKAGHPLGATFAGEPWSAGSYETRYGRVATVWLVWVAPEARRAGVGLAMLAWGRPHLLMRGFESAACTTLVGGTGGPELAQAYGIRPIETLYHISLKEEPRGQR